MLKKAIVSAFLFVATIGLTQAQDINGKWVGKVMDQFEISYTFKAEGEVLTGATKGPDGNEIIIKDGKINGNNLEFTINIMDQNTKVTGKLEGETLKLLMNAMGNDIEIILKKEGK
jgi:hypothetical protein